MRTHLCPACGNAKLIGELCQNCNEPPKVILSTPRERRERIATAAMSGLLSNVTKISGEWTGQLTPEFFAKQAVKAADALIRELDT